MSEEIRATFRRAISRLYHSDTRRVVGAGFLVADNLLFTCAHVVASALPEVNSSQKEKPERSITLDFPFEAWAVDQERNWTQVSGKVVCWYPVGHALKLEDIALIELTSPLPSGIQPVSLSSLSRCNRDDPVDVFGFPDGNDKGIWADAVYKGDSAITWLQIQDDKEQGYPIEPGFSGTLVWDAAPEVNAVVGMVVARDKKRKEAKLAYAIPAVALYEVLTQYLHQPVTVILEQLWSNQRSSLLRFLSTLRRPNHQLSPDALQLGGLSPELPSSHKELYQDLKQMGQRDYPADMLSCYVACLLEGAILNDVQRQQLLQWLIQIEPKYQDLLIWAAEYSQRSSQAGSTYSVGECSCLLIKVNREDNGFQVQGWIIPDISRYSPQDNKSRQIIDNPSDLNTIEDIQILRKIIGHYLVCSNQYDFIQLRIEIFLPRDLLSLPIDMWSQPEDEFQVPFGEDYAISIRSVDRITKMEIARQKWRKKWEKVVNNFQNPAKQILLRQDLSLFGLQDFRSDETIGLFYDQAPGNESRGVLMGLERFGIPIALWVRTEFSDIDLIEELQDIFSGTVAELPQKVKDYRSAALQIRLPDQDSCEATGQSPLVGHHLSLLWEDYHRIPPKRTLSSSLL